MLVPRIHVCTRYTGYTEYTLPSTAQVAWQIDAWVGSWMAWAGLVRASRSVRCALLLYVPDVRQQLVQLAVSCVRLPFMAKALTVSTGIIWRTLPGRLLVSVGFSVSICTN